MPRLSGTDIMMLAAETPSWHFQVGGLTILESDSDPRGMLRAIADELELRLPLAPKFMWKLRTVPFGLDAPVWVVDEEFDIRRHLHFVTLPSPGGRRELAEVAGRIAARPLDRRHPLWECYFIDGLRNNRAAMLMKYHHCMLDGVSGASLATVLNDIEAHPDHPPRPTGDEPRPENPSRLGLLKAAVPRVAVMPLRFGRFGVGLAQRAVTIATFSPPGGEVYRSTGAPRTSFNGTIGPRRALAFSSIAFDDVRAIKKNFNVKVNDVVLALCAGALQNYLIANGEILESELVVGVPVSTRGADTTTDNQIGNMCVKLATHVADPVERLLRIHENAEAAKGQHQAMRSHEIPSMGNIAPPFMLQALLRFINETHLANRIPTPMNTVVSNVAGPPFDLYMSGARVTGIYPTSVLMETAAVNITLFTYGDRMDFGVIVDPESVQDPFFIADSIPLALRDLLAAAGLGQPTPVTDPFD